jgi:16S rRNA (guanine527-N7)-methyltransferase
MAVPTAIARQIRSLSDVSRETLERLEFFVAGVEKWSRAINLVADCRPETIWARHVLDSMQLFPLRCAGGTTWCDLGSGGGFPGLVVAAMARELAPEMRLTLVESDRRKAAFLSVMARDLDVNATVTARRAESLAPQGAATVSARALAPLSRLLPLVSRHLAPDGVALLPKGRAFADEIVHARQSWAFTVEEIQSIVSPQSRILRVTELRSSDAP